MRVLLDENLPRRLKQHLPAEWEIATVPECGWNGKKNGELMRLAEQSFDCFLTMDRGVEFQQNIASYQLAAVLLRAPSNRLVDLLPMVPDIESGVSTTAKGKMIAVGGA